MYELANAVPDSDVLLKLEPEELGAKLLFLLRKRKFQRSMFAPANLNAELWSQSSMPGQTPAYPLEKREAIELALAEAWAWLEAQGLVVRAPEINGRNGWRVLSRRAQRFESVTEFAQFAVARMFPQQALHRRIAEKVWMAFMRAEFDVAVFQAMKAVEMWAREAGGLGNNLVAVPLMREAFAPDKGRLRT
jgi:hypothetical protein